MSSAVIQLIVLAGIAIFLILRLRSVLGSREGFEKPPVPPMGDEARPASRRNFEVIEGGPDRDITDHVAEGSDSARALAAMKQAEPSFRVGEFLHGARAAYEMILMAFERGDLAQVKPYLAPEVFAAFSEVVENREREGLQVQSSFVGIREVVLQEARFNPATRLAEVTVRFIGELTSVVRNAAGEIVEGNPNEIRRQRDVWTFARAMGSPDPNWQLSATGE